MMKRQMELFQEGGLKDEGGMIDAESGNEVPIGSTREEVRDDIPAKLSEGEFVMPADVVRYHGLDKMMALRDEAKMGLRKMDAMGQMGNSDEATLPEEMPFGMSDLIVIAEDGNEVEMAEGGYVTMANGGNASANTRQLGATYTPPKNLALNFKTVMGEGNISYKEYRNAEGKNILVAFIGGVPLYPVPEGYTEYVPGADVPITPIQELVEQAPTIPPADDNDNDQINRGYSLDDITNVSAGMILEEEKRQNSIFGKLAMVIVTAVGGPVMGAAVGFAKAKANEKNLARLKALETTPEVTAAIKRSEESLSSGFMKVLETGVGYLNKGLEFLGIDFPKAANDAADAVDKATGVRIPAPLRRPNAAEIAAANREGSLGGAAAAPSITSSSISDALRGGFDSSRRARADGTLETGPKVASAGPFTNEQLRQYNQGYMTAGDRYAMTMGGRGLQGTRPEGFGDQDLGYNPTVDPRGPSQIPASTRPFPNFDYESNMRDRNMRPPSGAPKTYDAFGNETISMGQGSSREDTGIPFDRDTRFVQDYIDNAASEDANVRRIPYADPGAYTFAPPFGMQDAMGQFPSGPLNVSPSNMQGPNFTPDSIDPRGPSQIPDSRRPFPASVPYDASFPREPAVSTLGTQPVGTQMSPNVGGTSGRLQDFRGGDPFKPLRGAGIGGSNMGTPDNVTDISTPETIEATGPTTSNYGTQTFNAFGEGVNPSLPVGQLPLYDASFEREPAVPANIPVSTNINLTSMSQFDLEQASLDGNEAASDELRARNIAENQAALRESGLDMPSSTLSTSRVPSVGQEEFSELQRSIPDPRGPSQIPDSTRPFVTADPRGRDQIPDSVKPFPVTDSKAAANREGSLGAGPRREATVTDSQLDKTDNTMFGLEDLETTGEVSAPSKATKLPPYEKGFGTVTPDKFNNLVPGQDLEPEFLRDAEGNPTTTKNPRAGMSFEYDINDPKSRTEANAKLNFFSKTGKARPEYILAGGRKVPADSAVAADDAKNTASGYTGTGSGGVAIGKISGENGLSGVVKDPLSKGGKLAAKVGGKTVYKDSSGKAYTRSTFGNKVEVKQNADGSWANKTNSKGEPVKYSKGTGVSSGHGTAQEQDNSSDKDESKIICTAMNDSYGFGSYRQAIWLSYSNKHLTKEHEVGYHTLFLPLVHLAYTKDNKLIRKLLEHGTRRRTADIRAELKGTKRNTLGRIYRSVLEPLCYGVGKIKMTLGE